MLFQINVMETLDLQVPVLPFVPRHNNSNDIRCRNGLSPKKIEVAQLAPFTGGKKWRQRSSCGMARLSHKQLLGRVRGSRCGVNELAFFAARSDKEA